jgi:hypothetical protein
MPLTPLTLLTSNGVVLQKVGSMPPQGPGPLLVPSRPRLSIVSKRQNTSRRARNVAYQRVDEMTAVAQ